MDPNKAEFYYNTYNQKGGDFPVFRGAKYLQYGSGFGDVLRGIFRHVLPIVSKGATAFLSGLLQGKNEGVSWAGAAKSALVPAAQAALSQAGTEISQTGSGKKKQKKKRKGGKHKISKKRKLYKGSKIKAKKQKLASPITHFNF